MDERERGRKGGSEIGAEVGRKMCLRANVTS